MVTDWLLKYVTLDLPELSKSFKLQNKVSNQAMMTNNKMNLFRMLSK